VPASTLLASPASTSLLDADEVVQSEGLYPGFFPGGGALADDIVQEDGVSRLLLEDLSGTLLLEEGGSTPGPAEYPGKGTGLGAQGLTPLTLTASPL
jgi:hypothetical protein